MNVSAGTCVTFYIKSADYLLIELNQRNYAIFECSHFNVWTFVFGFWCVVPRVYELLIFFYLFCFL